MSDSPIIQYVGFKVTPLVREYTFSVREATGAREFILNIANEAFVSRRARYQDAPAICALRLSAELAANSNHPQELAMRRQLRCEKQGAKMPRLRQG